MKILILISLTVMFFMGCGKADDSAPAPSTKSLWAQHDENTVLLGCTETADAGIPPGTTGTNLDAANTIVDVYCNCMLTEVMNRWSPTDFAANGAADFQTLSTDGTVAKCQAAAGQ